MAGSLTIQIPRRNGKVFRPRYYLYGGSGTHPDLVLALTAPGFSYSAELSEVTNYRMQPHTTVALQVSNQQALAGNVKPNEAFCDCQAPSDLKAPTSAAEPMSLYVDFDRQMRGGPRQIIGVVGDWVDPSSSPPDTSTVPAQPGPSSSGSPDAVSDEIELPSRVA